MREFDTALVLSRVLTSGIVMSIERNDRELPGLERLLGKQFGAGKATRVSLVNSRTAAVHGAVAGLGIGHGDQVVLPDPPPWQRAFLNWLGIEPVTGGTPDFEFLEIGPDWLDAPHPVSGAKVLALDLGPLGFGPAGAVVTSDETVYARAERLKIFGAYDLRTMWTQDEASPELVPGVQFNYRLSPLVAACIRTTLASSAGQTTKAAA
jgi:dTDP-4-amino-4,6-dideoxygalactose transaminase